MPSKNPLHRKWIKCHVCRLSIHPDEPYWNKYTLIGDRVSWHADCDKMMEGNADV